MSSDNAAILKPGEIITPFLDLSGAEALIKDLYGLNPTNLKEFNSYDDKNIFFKAQNDYENENLKEINPDGYILKVSNSKDSLDPAFFDAQNAFMLHLSSKGFDAPTPIRDRRGRLQSLNEIECASGDAWTTNNVGERPRGSHIVRVLNFIPGKILFDVDPWTGDHFYQCGRYVARMDEALRDFEHEGYRDRITIWSLNSLPKVGQFTFAVKEEGKRRLAEEIIGAFSEEVVPNLDRLESGMIHGDFNEQNILLRENADSGEYEVSSVIDFGDSHEGYFLFELAITMMYMMTRCKSMHPNLAGGHCLAGYLAERGLSDLEMDLLRTCVAGRYAQSLVMGTYSYSQNPGNEYLLTTVKDGWRILSEFWAVPKEELYNQWKDIVKSYEQ